ncbi:MAG: hypothetical protein RXO36_01550 [Candidatus Nanopusillus acidilobi]|jgi:hypothetical protein
MDILGIGLKLSLEEGKVTIKKEKEKMILEYNNKMTSSSNYKDYKKNWQVTLLIKDNKIQLIESNVNLYIYNFNDLSDKNKIYGLNQLIYLGYLLKKSEEFILKFDKYLISPTEKISIGNGKIGSDFDSKLINEEKIARDILYITDGFLIINNII